MRLDIRDRLRRNLSALQRGPDYFDLRELARRRETGRSAVLVDRGSLDESVNVIAVGEGVGPSLEDDEAAALAAYEAVRAGVERLAAPVRRQRVVLRDGDRGLGRDHQVHAAGQREIAFSRAQALTGEMHAHERRGACRVDRDARPAESEDIRKAPGGHAERVACTEEGVNLARVSVSHLQLPVVVRADADEDSGPGANQIRRCLACVFQSLPGDLEQQPLLRIHRGCLARRNPEEVRIEAIHVLEERAPARGHLSGRFWIRVVEGGRIPAV